MTTTPEAPRQTDPRGSVRNAVRHAVDEAFKTPVADPIPHPALDVAVVQAEEGGKVDKVVFGVTAAIAVGFVAWGFISTEPRLSSASTAHWPG